MLQRLFFRQIWLENYNVSIYLNDFLKDKVKTLFKLLKRTKKRIVIYHKSTVDLFIQSNVHQNLDKNQGIYLKYNLKKTFSQN